MAFKVPNQFRIRRGQWATSDDCLDYGAFILKLKHSQILQAIACADEGWEHVSVSREDRCPTWEEMCQVKALFWDPEDTVIEYHPPASEYVNNHPYCLHLWRPTKVEIPRPPSNMVAP